MMSAINNDAPFDRRSGFAIAMENAFAGKLESLQECGEDLRKMLSAGVEAWATIKSCLDEINKGGYNVEGQTAVPGRLEAIKKLFKQFSSNWPICCKDEIEHGRQQIRSGEFVTGEELISVLRAKNSNSGSGQACGMSTS